MVLKCLQDIILSFIIMQSTCVEILSKNPKVLAPRHQESKGSWDVKLEVHYI